MNFYICSKCYGTGFVDSEVVCPKCNGKKILDWIENITGVYDNKNKLSIKKFISSKHPNRVKEGMIYYNVDQNKNYIYLEGKWNKL